MADAKISALTAATLPLDGTEVLPIVQSSATKKVANNDLRPKQIQSNATTGVMQIVGPAASATRVMTIPDANFTAARTDAAQTFTGNQTFNTSMALSAVDPDFTYTRYKTSVSGSPFFTLRRSRGASAGVNTIVQAGDWLGGIVWQGANGTGYSDAAYLYATVNGTPGASNDMPGAIRMATSADGSASPTTRLDIGADGNVIVSTGNLVIGTSGKGIDFSADGSAAGMTSELLDDYEEGTWTPNQGGNVTVVGSFSSSGSYTKIGRQVTIVFSITGSISVAVTAGGVICTNAPFTSGGFSGIGSVYEFGAHASTCLVGNLSTNIYSSVAIPAAGTINFTITYFI